MSCDKTCDKPNANLPYNRCPCPPRRQVCFKTSCLPTTNFGIQRVGAQVQDLCDCKFEGPQGPTGERGEVGPQGEVGPPGVTGMKGMDGVTGMKGEVGPPGATGMKGEVGATGMKGEVGPPGATGPQGEVGPPGATGPQGEVGPTGPQGEVGPPGATGPQGEVGPPGVTGPQGEVGPTGPPGTGGGIFQFTSDQNVGASATRYIGQGNNGNDTTGGFEDVALVIPSAGTIKQFVFANKRSITSTSIATVYTRPANSLAAPTPSPSFTITHNGAQQCAVISGSQSVDACSLISVRVSGNGTICDAACSIVFESS